MLKVELEVLQYKNRKPKPSKIKGFGMSAKIVKFKSAKSVLLHGAPQLEGNFILVLRFTYGIHEILRTEMVVDVSPKNGPRPSPSKRAWTISDIRTEKKQEG